MKNKKQRDWNKRHEKGEKAEETKYRDRYEGEMKIKNKKKGLKVKGKVKRLELRETRKTKRKLRNTRERGMKG